ncbi:hypothetical protein [Micromonospora sp. LH3U1]|uniref:hypothetical protein n=1 Tax=Micromonospora sp. LH3U1 TaxID=3018339 RepID=UPI00234A913F|nr:hypothetical protein [Micromonospora sp. LH3U1]WCN83963.1 hypothetical protein PCA76_13390 [Micromonospora sp. LH3U1]
MSRRAAVGAAFASGGTREPGAVVTSGDVVRNGKESLYSAAALLRLAIVDRPGQLP